MTKATVHLFNGPYVTIGDRRIEVPEGSKRLVAFVALRGCRIERRLAAGTLWPFGDDNRAAGNLRSSLWRLRSAGVDTIIDADKWSLALADGVDVDVAEVDGWADRVMSNRPTEADFDGIASRGMALDLLPGCYDDWVIGERERFRQRTLHALESLSRLCVAAGRHGDAVEAALTAVHAEPLRESAQRVLIEAHLGEHNLVEARRTFHAYRRLVSRELGVAPSPELYSIVRLPADHVVSQFRPAVRHDPRRRAPA